MTLSPLLQFHYSPNSCKCTLYNPKPPTPHLPQFDLLSIPDGPSHLLVDDTVKYGVPIDDVTHLLSTSNCHNCIGNYI